MMQISLHSPQPRMENLTRADLLFATLTSISVRSDPVEKVDVFDFLEASFAKLLGESTFYCLIYTAAMQSHAAPFLVSTRRFSGTRKEFYCEVKARFDYKAQKGPPKDLVDFTQMFLDRLTLQIGAPLTHVQMNATLRKYRAGRSGVRSRGHADHETALHFTSP